MKPSLLRMSLLCLGMTALAACGGGNQAQAPQMPPPEVGVVQVAPRNSPLTRDLVGRLSAYRSADVRARVAGVVLKRAYAEGSQVKQGQLLFQIDPAPFRAALSAAQASLAQAEASHVNAKVNAKRARELAPKGYVSAADLDNALATERTTAAAVQAARANVETARINLGYANVTAPIAGRAGQQQVTEGALVGSDSATLLTTIDQTDPMYVNFTLSVDAMESMRRAEAEGGVTLAKANQAKVDIALPDGSRYGEPGMVDFSDVQVNPATGAINLRAVVPNPKQTLLPGMYVTLTAHLGQQHQVYLLPQPAIQRDTGGAYVLVVGKDNKVERRDVALGQMQGADWVVSEGLASGERVIVSGVQNAKPGEPVKPVDWQPIAVAKPAAAAPQAH